MQRWISGRGQPLALLLAAVVAVVSLSGARACTAPCPDPRPFSSASTTYCLVKFDQACDFIDTTTGNKNLGCEPCSLWRESTTACGTPTGADLKTCSKGFVLRKDKCVAGGDNKWKTYPSKKAYVGVETIKADPNGMKFTHLKAQGLQLVGAWPHAASLHTGRTSRNLMDPTHASSLPHPRLPTQLWDSALTGANPCGTTLSWSSNPSIAMMENAVEYRTKHLMHAHIGSATPEFRTCVDAHVAAATKAKVWTPLIKCNFTNRGTAGTADTFVWLQGPLSRPTARPLNVGTIVNKAFKSTGPLNSGVYNDQQNDYSGFGVTTATFNNKNYFAVMVYNYEKSFTASQFKFQVGEYELIRGG